MRVNTQANNYLNNSNRKLSRRLEKASSKCSNRRPLTSIHLSKDPLSLAMKLRL